MSQLSYVFNPLGDFLNCLSFNSGFDVNGQPVELLRSAASAELSMELYVGLPDALRTSVVVRGANIQIQNQSESPIKLTPSPIKLSAGIHTRVRVVRNVYKQFNEWPYAYSACTVGPNNELIKPLTDRSLFDQVLATNYTYAQDTCLLACFQRLVSQNCNCTVYWVDFRLDGYDRCFGERVVCSFYYFFKVYLLGDYINRECMPLCPLECTRQRFDNYLSLEPYSSADNLEHVLRRNSKLVGRYANDTDFREHLGENVVKFTVKYGELAYREAREEKRMSWDALLGQIGGHLHLFMGMSLLSFVEIFELLF